MEDEELGQGREKREGFVSCCVKWLDEKEEMTESYFWCKSQQMNSGQLVLLIEFNSTHLLLISQLIFFNL